MKEFKDTLAIVIFYLFICKGACFALACYGNGKDTEK